MSDKLASLERRLFISRTYAASVGYFLTAFSMVEGEMDRAVWAVSNMPSDEGGLELTTAIRDFGQRMLLLSKLSKARLTNEKHRTDCASVIKALQFLNDRRVELVHGALSAWMASDEHAIIERSKAERTKVVQAISEFSTDYLCELTDFAFLTQEALMKFRVNLQRGADLTLPSLDTRPKPPARVMR